jgi:hypothetical protein
MSFLDGIFGSGRPESVRSIQEPISRVLNLQSQNFSSLADADAWIRENADGLRPSAAAIVQYPDGKKFRVVRSEFSGDQGAMAGVEKMGQDVFEQINQQYNVGHPILGKIPEGSRVIRNYRELGFLAADQSNTLAVKDVDLTLPVN